MKNSKEYSSKVASFYKNQQKNVKSVKPNDYASPVDAMVHGVVLEYYSVSESAKIIEKIATHFVDWNDLRVSRNEEIVDVLSGDKEIANKAATALTLALQKTFDRFDAINLEGIVELGKRAAKHEMEEMEMLSLFGLNYFLLEVMQSHSLPMTEAMIELVKENGLVHPKADNKDITSFMERQVSASEIATFYNFLRQISEASSSKTTKKTTKKKTTKKVATKKKATKKTKKKTAKK